MADIDRLRTLILASSSTFRRQMLERAGIVFTVLSADVDEPAIRDEMRQRPLPAGASEIAMALAEAKARAVAAQHPDALVLGSDQILECQGEIFGKPPDTATARRQLQTLRGATHYLHTAAALVIGRECVYRCLTVPRLKMRAFSDVFLDDYVAREAVTETVGGYKLEGYGIQLFDDIHGDYFSIIGLPLLDVLSALRRHGQAPT